MSGHAALPRRIIKSRRRMYPLPCAVAKA
jgi:hypothetical protein